MHVIAAKSETVVLISALITLVLLVFGKSLCFFIQDFVRAMFIGSFLEVLIGCFQLILFFFNALNYIALILAQLAIMLAECQ